MFMSFFDKIQLIFKHSFSSFLAIELLLLSILFFVLLGLNIKQKKKIVNYAAIAVVIAFIATLIVLNYEYTVYCVDFFLKSILEYIYFPSTVIYFFIMFLVTIFIIITIMSDKLSFFKKIINYLCFAMLYFLFFSFISVVSYTGVDLADKVQLYTNDLILALVQISNLVFLCWIIYTIFWYLFKYFKKKYD